MAIKAIGGNTGGDFEPVPEGVHFAICSKIIFLGLQEETFDGVKKELEKVYLGFEVPDIQHEYQDKNGKTVSGPAVIGRTFTLNIGPKSNLGPFLTNWRSKQFTDDELTNGYDLERLAGIPCQLGVTHATKNGKTYANITSAGALIKEVKEAIANGTRSVTPANGILIYNPYEHSNQAYEKVPKFLKAKIENRIVKRAAAKTANVTPDFDDNIPF